MCVWILSFGGCQKCRNDLTCKLRNQTADQFTTRKTNIAEHQSLQWTTHQNLDLGFFVWKATFIDLGIGHEAFGRHLFMSLEFVWQSTSHMLQLCLSTKQIMANMPLDKRMNSALMSRLFRKPSDPLSLLVDVGSAVSIPWGAGVHLWVTWSAAESRAWKKKEPFALLKFPIYQHPHPKQPRGKSKQVSFAWLAVG